MAADASSSGASAATRTNPFSRASRVARSARSADIQPRDEHEILQDPRRRIHEAGAQRGGEIGAGEQRLAHVRVLAEPLHGAGERGAGHGRAGIAHERDETVAHAHLDERGADRRGDRVAQGDGGLRQRIADGGGVDQVGVGQQRRQAQDGRGDFRLVGGERNDDVAGRVGAGGEFARQRQAHQRRGSSARAASAMQASPSSSFGKSPASSARASPAAAEARSADEAVVVQARNLRTIMKALASIPGPRTRRSADPAALKPRSIAQHGKQSA